MSTAPHDFELEERVFDFLPETRIILDASRAAVVSPWVVLGHTMLRGLLQVSPRVTVPTGTVGCAGIGRFFRWWMRCGRRSFWSAIAPHFARVRDR